MISARSVFGLFSIFCLVLTPSSVAFGKSPNIEEWLKLAENAVCPGTAVNSCRNETCNVEVSKVFDCDPVVGASIGGKYHTSESCTNKFSAQTVTFENLAKLGITIAPDEAQLAIKNYSTLQCNVIRDENAPLPTDDLCGNNTPEITCQYLGRDACLTDQVVVFARCVSLEHCGMTLGKCRTVLNGIDYSQIDLQKLNKIEETALSIFELSFLGHKAKLLTESDAHNWSSKALIAAQNSKLPELIQIQLDVRKALAVD